MKKILILGQKSFVGSYIDKKLSFKTQKISFEKFKKKNENYLKKFDYIINCASNLNFVKKKYNQKYDYDLFVSNKIKNLDCKQIMLSTRKVYKSSPNIKENSKIEPKSSYSKNKLISEKKVQSIMNKKILILRISNLLGFDRNEFKRKLHFNFLDHFLKNIKKGILFKNPKIYKDFLPISLFIKILNILIKKDCYGVYNVSFGNKILLDKILNWLNYYNTKPFKRQSFKKSKNSENQDCFFLNNDKLKKIIDIKMSYKTLEIECKKISKEIFNEK
tara:strand:- start:2952 stop:3776 length:825 start_codon:yes stop_codon:yes gene_type:complete